MGIVDIQRMAVHGDHEPVWSGDGLVAPNSFKNTLRRGTSRPPSKVRFMESRRGAHGPVWSFWSWRKADLTLAAMAWRSWLVAPGA